MPSTSLDGRTIEAPALKAGPAAVVLLIALAATVSMTMPLLAGDTVDPNNDGSQYAWSENAGWLNAEPLGDG